MPRDTGRPNREYAYDYNNPVRPRRCYPYAQDACLAEGGCCFAEGMGPNCLIASLVLLPHLLGAALHRPGPGGTRHTGLAARMVAAIGVYQREISANRSPVCRFTPSCSRYAATAITTHGALRGTVLAIRRLLRCRPGRPGGADPVPAT